MTTTKSRGPGPGAYCLPTTVGFPHHDVSMQRYPQYSFGIQHKNIDARVSPGPGAYKVEKVNRYGGDGTPKFSFRPRIDIPEKSRGPGPAAHDVCYKPSFKGKTAPAYTLRPQLKPIGRIVSPSANSYMVRVSTIKPTAPSYTMGKDLTKPAPVRSPGPATYGRTDLNVRLFRSPAYSLRPLNKYAFSVASPGANTYNMAYYKPGKKSPSYSFGVRHSDYAPPMVVRCDNL